MAARHLKRLQDLADTQAHKAADENEDEDEAEESSSKPFNPFDLLSDDDAAEASRSDEDEADAPQQQQVVPPSSDSKKPVVKRKTKAAKSALAAGGESGSDRLGDSGASTAPATDDIDRLVQELNLKTVGTSGAAAMADQDSDKALLSVDLRCLHGDDELRRIFGSDVVQSVDRQDGGPAPGFGAGPRGRRRAAPAAGGRAAAGRRRPLKRGALITPREHWPALDVGLSMQYVGTQGSAQLFRYVYSPSYRGTQRMFEECQASYDPNSIAALLHQAPYQVDALLAMYDLYRHMGDHAYAEDCLQRALYALEMAWHSGFSITTGRCRLDYEVEENRGLFTALFRHAQALSRQGCHRTGLEVCKLLLALSPEDPMGALCMVDYLAIRAGQYAFLRRFVLDYDGGSTSLALLPNYAYASALAAFRQEQQQERAASAAEARQRSSRRATASVATEGSGRGTAGLGSQELLVQALLLHPLVLSQVVAKLQDKGSAREAAWAKLLARRPFKNCTDGGSASLSHLVAIYAERSALLWKDDSSLAFLQAGAMAAADIAEGKGTQEEGLVMDADDWAAVRTEAFPPDDKNEYRHLRLHDFSDNVNALPREEVNAAMAAGGLPEVDLALEQMLAQAHDEQHAAAGRGGAAMTDEELRAANPMMMLLRSLLPWVDAGQQPEYDAQQGPAQEPHDG